MSVVAHTKETLRIPVGDRTMVTIRCSGIVAEDAGDEWLQTGLSWIDAVVGYVLIGATTSTESFTFVKNAKGTDETAGTAGHEGCLGFETTVDVDVFDVTVIGQPGQRN